MNAYKLAVIENIATLVTMVILILGIAIIFHSLHCFWGLVMLLNMSSYKKESK